MSLFAGLNTALTALHAHRAGLDVAGQNIANANTEGYTRQRADLRALGAPPVPAIHATWSGTGAGVTVDGVERLRDAFLENRGRGERAQQAYLGTLDQAYGFMESALGEPSDTALAAQLSEFWAGWHDVANNPADIATRNQVLQRAGVVADGLHAAHDALGSLWTNTRADLDTLVVEVNTTATAVAQLNETIRRAEGAGLAANELIDQRDVHVMHLGELVGATALARADGTVDVYVNGSTLVAGGTSRALAVTGAGRLADQSADPVSLRWADSGVPTAAGGRIAAQLTLVGSVLPGQAAEFDDIAARLADTVNTQHRAGYGLDGVGDRPFFSGSTATTLAVAITDARHLAASGASGGTYSGSNADSLAALAKRADGADATYRSMTVKLAVVAQSTARRADLQREIVTEVDAAREAASGVNLDEEMTNMLAYQRAYEAASRLLTTVDGVLDVLINRTGLVGR
jgi:flagellar hook-associated protein 1 FlgK